jgi:hypothetical protein
LNSLRELQGQLEVLGGADRDTANTRLRLAPMVLAAIERG